ncbi:MAG: hypothetical protein QF595_03715, partial [Dehalococcoidia bacterium]|nr:hypothetical protein [Dehalococcoidia bacterium]
MRGYEPRGREFESLRARHKNNDLGNHTLGALSHIHLFIPNHWAIRVMIDYLKAFLNHKAKN